MKLKFWKKVPVIKCGICGKTCYDKVTAQTQVNFRHKFGIRLRIYSCDWCGMWHVTKHTRDGEKYD